MTSTPTRPDGLPYEVQWQGHSYLTPPGTTLDFETSCGIFRNPLGQDVGAESADCWLQLIGLLPHMEKKHA